MAKITQGIGKKLNASEARASISLHKITQKESLVYYVLISFSLSWLHVINKDFYLRTDTVS